MAKRLVWTEDALRTRKEILEYWISATGDKNYSIKLDQGFEETASLLLLFPELGKKIENFDARFILKKDYTIIYKVEADESNLEIKVLQIWDTRRDPYNLKI